MRGAGRALFAATLLLIVGTLNIIGIGLACLVAIVNRRLRHPVRHAPAHRPAIEFWSEPGLTPLELAS
jgi:hypothetical protein